MNNNDHRQGKLLQSAGHTFTKPQENWAWALKWDWQALAAVSKKRGLHRNGTDLSREDSLSSHS